MDPYASLAAGGIAAVVIIFAVAGIGVTLSLWLLYTVIWRAVRRGLKEYHSPAARQSSVPSYPPRNW